LSLLLSLSTPGHALLVTKQYHSQSEPLQPEDFAALSLCSDGAGWLAFYNCGPLSGRSQPHKHVQLLPYPFDRAATRLDRLADLPFLHSLSVLSSSGWHDAAANCKLYQTALALLGSVAESHNVLITKSRMLIVPRRKEEFEHVGLNALAFSFSVLVTSQVQRHKTRETALKKKNLGKPAVAGTTRTRQRPQTRHVPKTRSVKNWRGI
jgi:ATP adenylyltransferase